jgi:hypothetical protein
LLPIVLTAQNSAERCKGVSDKKINIFSDLSELLNWSLYDFFDKVSKVVMVSSVFAVIRKLPFKIFF